MSYDVTKYANELPSKTHDGAQAAALPKRPPARPAASPHTVSDSASEHSFDGFESETTLQDGRQSFEAPKNATLAPAPSRYASSSKHGVRLSTASISTADSTDTLATATARRDDATKPLLKREAPTPGAAEPSDVSAAAEPKAPSTVQKVLQGTVMAFRLLTIQLKRPLVQKALFFVASVSILVSFAALAGVSGGTLGIALFALAIPVVAVIISTLREHPPAWLQKNKSL